MRLGFVALTLAGLALTGCEEEGGSAAAGGLPGKTPVVGTETCQRAVDSDEVLDDGTEVMVETFTCDTVMSDPRGSGREVLHIETTLLEEDDVSFDGSSWTKDRLGHNVTALAVGADGTLWVAAYDPYTLVRFTPTQP